MRCVRFVIGWLFVSALLLTAAMGWCADQNDTTNLDLQIAERTKQYQESLRQRASQVSPSFQATIESQVRRTVAKGLAKWQNGEIDLCIALPNLAERQRVALFAIRHIPGVPTGSLTWKSSDYVATVTVTSVRLVLKSPVISTANFAFIRSFFCSFWQSGECVSYFVRVVWTIVKRR